LDEREEREPVPFGQRGGAIEHDLQHSRQGTPSLAAVRAQGPI